MYNTQYMQLPTLDDSPVHDYSPQPSCYAQPQYIFITPLLCKTAIKTTRYCIAKEPVQQP